MPKQCGTHLSAEDRETLSLSLTQGHSLWTLAMVFVCAQHRKPRVHPQFGAETVSCLPGIRPGGGHGIGKTRRGKGAKILTNMDRHGLLLSVSDHTANQYEVTLAQLNEDG